MKLDLYINEANDYARDIRVPILHPHVAIIHYDEVGEIRHSLNRIDCYGIFLQREFPENLTYGIGIYHEGDGSLIAFAPGHKLGASAMTAAGGSITVGCCCSTLYSSTARRLNDA